MKENWKNRNWSKDFANFGQVFWLRCLGQTGESLGQPRSGEVLVRCLGSCFCLPPNTGVATFFAVSFGTKAITICICLLLFAFGSGELSNGRKGLFPILKGLARSTGMLECCGMFNVSCKPCVSFLVVVLLTTCFLMPVLHCSRMFLCYCFVWIYFFQIYSFGRYGVVRQVCC